MKKVIIPSTYRYVGVFLTLSCNLSCSYCINHLVGLKQGRKLLNGEDWSRALSRLEFSGPKLPLSLQGGEPTIHKNFYEIVNGIPETFELDLLTNIQFDPKVFAEKISVSKFNRDAPYAAIRVSYHPETMDFMETKNKVKELMELGFRVGLYTVAHPDALEEIERIKSICSAEGIDFRTKEFLGVHEGKRYGHYRWDDACFVNERKNCLCKTTELLIDPFGDVYRCHHDLYNKISPVGNLLDEDFEIQDIYRECAFFGNCNPCDVKVKNNYLQEFGHTSVDIKFDLTTEAKL
ncbi:MAG TPA: hypothetical protein VKZ84_02170 [Bacteriovoracaceae bacterium]|nr:hypothetical protein [Bacteriovoracaceae bacterium]